MGYSLKIDQPTSEEKKMDQLMLKAVEAIEDQESEFCRHDVEPIECRRRDGFIPHSHNQGGYSVHILKPLSVVNEDEYQKSRDHHAEHVKSDHPEMDVESDDFQDLVYDSMAESQDDICYLEARVMFNGIDDEGTYHATLEMIYRTSDAPYFRYADSYEDFKMEWKTAEELEMLLEFNLNLAGVK